MLELYLSLGLITLGYYFSNQTEITKKSKETFLNNEYYQLDNSKQLEQQAAEAAIMNTESTFVPSLEQPVKLSNRIASNSNEIVSKLSGKTMDKTTFKTNDVGKIAEPFFGKNVTQSTKDLNIPNRLLETNGLSQFDCKKKETGQFFTPTANLTFVAGTPSMDQKYIDNYYKTNKRNGELPFKQELVAPGLGQNYGNEGVGGYQQSEIQDIVKPKNVDELRRVNKPKLSYKGRTVSGKRINTSRGKVGNVDKNLPETYYENSEDRYFKTTGAILKTKADERFVMNETNRQDSRFFVGGLKSDNNRHKLQQKVQKTNRNIYQHQAPSNKTAKGNWNENNSNYNKNSYNAYPNERDITQKRTHKNNVVTAVKSIITPIQDLIKKTKKENFTGNNRPEGNMGAMVPKKQTVYDSNQVARTTIKESTIHNNHKGIMNGPTKLTTYDPNQVARATTKETLIHNKSSGTLTSNNKPKQVTYDTKPKITLRNTLKNIGTNHNMNGPRKLETFNKNNPPRKTIKETTVDKVREGHIRDIKDDGYKVFPASAPNTSKQFMSDNEYSGSANSLHKASKNYDAEYNASLNINKEVISRGRAPTQNNVKVANGGDTINTINKKQQSGTAPPAPSEGIKHIATASEIGVTLSHHKDQLNVSQGIDRIGVDMLEALKSNPFAKSVTDTGPEFTLSKNTISNNMENEQLKLAEERKLESIIEAEIAKLV
jgi:hypothetical protein